MCFHNYVSKKCIARRAIFSFLVTSQSTSKITNFLCLCSPSDTIVDSKTPDYEAVTGLYANTTNDSSNPVYSDPSIQAPPLLPPFNPMILETSPIPVNELGNYVSEKHFGMNAGFKAEFQVWSGVRNNLCQSSLYILG